MDTVLGVNDMETATVDVDISGIVLAVSSEDFSDTKLVVVDVALVATGPVVGVTVDEAELARSSALVAKMELDVEAEVDNQAADVSAVVVSDIVLVVEISDVESC